MLAKNPGDMEQIRLIRMHLEDIATRFHQGDYSGPAQTHGEEMPGLAQLKAAKAGEITTLYTNVANGGQIEYFAKRPEPIAAIHEWFDENPREEGRTQAHPNGQSHDGKERRVTREEQMQGREGLSSHDYSRNQPRFRM